MKNISIIELQEDELDTINAAGAASFFKKVGKGIARGASEVAGEVAATFNHAGSIVKKTGDALIKKCS